MIHCYKQAYRLIQRTNTEFLLWCLLLNVHNNDTSVTVHTIIGATCWYAVHVLD